MSNRKLAALVKDRSMRRTVTLSMKWKGDKIARMRLKSILASVYRKRGERKPTVKTTRKITDEFELSMFGLSYFGKSLKIPEDWSRVPVEGMPAYYHAALVRNPYFAMTVKISDDISARALASGNYTTFIRNRIYDALRSRFKDIQIPSYWFVLEGVTDSLTEGHHIHGAITYRKDFKSKDEQLIRAAIKHACGPDYPPLGRQCKLRDHGTVDLGEFFYWGAGYTVKEHDLPGDERLGKRFARTTDLTPDAKRIYEGYRTIIKDELMKKRRRTSKR